MAKVIKLSAQQTSQFWPVPVVYEDVELLALDKPSGLSVTLLPNQTADEPTLVKLLHAGIAAGKSWAVESGISYLQPVHHLDAEASGLLLFAKTKTAFTTLTNTAGSDQLNRTYLALIQGCPGDDTWEVDLPINPKQAPSGFFRVDDRRGKKSLTKFEVVERYSRWSLIKCRPAFDRPHQIRAHLAVDRMPLAGDPLYRGGLIYLSRLKKNYSIKEGADERPMMSRPALHSETVQISHPATGADLILTCPPPKDFAVTIKYLKRFA
jgi:RluA family pseudouridine synthase